MPRPEQPVKYYLGVGMVFLCALCGIAAADRGNYLGGFLMVGVMFLVARIASRYHHRD